jgi:hypothetical protein
MKLAKDIEVGDELLGPNRERYGVYQVQQLPGGALLVSRHVGGKIAGGGLFRPHETVTEYADEFPEFRGCRDSALLISTNIYPAPPHVDP